MLNQSIITSRHKKEIRVLDTLIEVSQKDLTGTCPIL